MPSPLLDPTIPMRSFNPADLSQGECYKLMSGLIVPRPVALVSTVDQDGIANVAPFGYFTGVGLNPPTLLFCPSLRSVKSGRSDNRNDTLRNVEKTGEFVVNVVSESLAGSADAAAAEVGPEIDEFELVGLTPIPSEVVRAPRVAESPAQFECKLMQIVFTGQEDGAGVVVLGEIVRVHVHPDLGTNFRIDPDKLDAVGRMAGNTWARTRDRFDVTSAK